MARTMPKPLKAGQCYAKNGFAFRIDRVNAKHVYVLRLKDGGWLCAPMRVTVRKWNKEMGDAKRLKEFPPPTTAEGVGMVLR